MKFALVIIAMAAVGAYANEQYTHGHNGRSACKDPSEYYGKFLNNFDPTIYWSCDEPGVPASLYVCPDGYAFLDATKTCVTWANWHWTDTYDPITMA